MTGGELGTLILKTYGEWSRHRAPRLGAALAYYTLFSLAPLLVLSVFMAGLAFGETAARGHIFWQIRDLLGEEGAAAVKALLEQARGPRSGVLAGVLGVAALLFGATGAFAELRDALNTIWEVPSDDSWTNMLHDRLFAFLLVLGVGFLLLVSLVISAGLSAAGKFFGNILPTPEIVLQSVNFLFSFLMITGLFAMIYRILPEAPIRWSDVWIGAAATSFLFSIGKLLIGLYLGKSGLASSYGAAGSLVVVLVWVYYSAQIFFMGAAFTHVYARTFGSHARAGKASENGAGQVIGSRSAPSVGRLFESMEQPLRGGPGVKIISHGKHKVNVGTGERVASIAGGGALLYYGLRRRSWGGAGMALLGGGLIYRGASGHSNLYQTLGLHTAHRTGGLGVPYELGMRVDRSVTISRPPEEVYRFWRDLENLPHFMKHLEGVRKVDDKRSHWIARAPAGRTVEWDAEIINEKENELIGWRSLPGSSVELGGSVRFTPAPGGRGTVVTVSFQYNPPGGIAGAAVARLFGEEPQQQVSEDLQRFKQLMEAGEIPTTEAQPSGRAGEPAEAKRAGRLPRRPADRPDQVEDASAASFPASDAPGWSAIEEGIPAWPETGRRP